MTKEELKQEAEKYVKQNYCEMCVMADDCKCGCIDCFTVQAYLASAEPREKKIKSLGERCLQLQKNKSELTDKIKELQNGNFVLTVNEIIEGKDKKIAELEAQIEKMKCDVLSLIKDRMNDDIDQNIIERLAEKWEIKEK